MDLNLTKRKRTVPTWMKPSNSSPTKSPNKTICRAGAKQQRPSYPEIVIKKTQIPKPQKDVVPHQQKNLRPPSTSKVKDDHESKSVECGSSFSIDFQAGSSSPDNDYFMTVDELTSIAQEIINEDKQKRRLL